MNERDKAKLAIQIANEEYSEPDFGISWKGVLLGFVIGMLVALIVFR